MRFLISLLVKFFVFLGLAKTIYHLDFARVVHLTVTLVDDASGNPIDAVTVYFERPAEGSEPSPYMAEVAGTGADGRIDERVVAVWSHEIEVTAAPLPPAPPPPQMHAVLRKLGYREARIGFDLTTLTVVTDAAELPLGQVRLSP